jgi:glycosyltransferase involved in cell wall biosynthesis
MALRVLQVMAGNQHGGAEAFFQRLVIRRKVERTERTEQLRQAGIRVQEQRFGGLFDLSTRLALRTTVRAYRPDVVLCWMSRAATLMPSRRWAGDSAVRVGRLGGYYDLKYYRNCDHLIGNTRDIVRYIVDAGWPKDRAHYLPNFVDAGRAAPLDRGGSGDRKLALALGRLHSNKAFDVLLEALAKAPEIDLWLAGEGEQRASLTADVNRLGLGGRVRFLGWRDDVASLMATADMVICPSRHEPLGNVVIEAWAQQRPVICAASAGPAALIDSGRNGLLVPVDDADALAATMSRLAADSALANAIAAGGYASYEAEFTKDIVVRRYIEFLTSVAGSCAA